MSAKVILHVDLDCFFVQVERRRNPLLYGKPVAVRQHQDIICVSYEARNLGVKKHEDPTVAAQRVPSLTVVHVFQEHGKVSYRVYKEAMEKIVSILHHFLSSLSSSSSFIIEQSSFDEVYIDISELVAEKVNEDKITDNSISQSDEYVVGEFSNSLLENTSYKVGTEIVREARKLICEKLGYTSSAGISCNKMFAKIASGMNKPNKQTLILQSAVEELLNELPICKLPKMGGKTGKLIEEEIGAKFISDVQTISLETLVSKLGDKTGNILFNLCRGKDDRKVETNAPARSIVCGMSLNPIHTLEQVEKIFMSLATDMIERLRIYYNKHGKRSPQNLVVGIRKGEDKTQKNHTLAFPKWNYEENVEFKKREEEDRNNRLMVVNSAMNLFKSDVQNTQDWFVTRLSLVATNFKAEPNSSLNKFFSPKNNNNNNSNNNNDKNNTSNNNTSPNNTNNNKVKNINNNDNTNNNAKNNPNTNINKSNVYKKIKFEDEDDLFGYEEEVTITLTNSIKNDFTCGECKRKILDEEKQSHLDMHMAERLQKEEEEKINKTKNILPSPKKQKVANPKISNFFKSSS